MIIMNKKILGIIFIIISICSCRTGHLEGTYIKVYNGTKYVPYLFSLELNNDSTYNYLFNSGWIKEISNGRWNVKNKKKTLILSGYISDLDRISIVVNESENKELQNKTFVFDTLTMDSAIWSININGINYPVRGDSIIIPRDIIIDKFYLHGHKDFVDVIPRPLQKTVKSEVYCIGNTKSNLFHISFRQLIDSNIFYYESINDSLIVNKNTLIWKDKNIKLKKVNK